ncbi:MAG: EamA family transporter, partial [Anaerotignaceae bacterium]
MTTKKATILLLALSMMWGSSFVFSSMAMEQGMAATDVVFIRFFLGTILLYLVTYKRFSIKNIEKT